MKQGGGLQGTLLLAGLLLATWVSLYACRLLCFQLQCRWPVNEGVVNLPSAFCLQVASASAWEEQDEGSLQGRQLLVRQHKHREGRRPQTANSYVGRTIADVTSRIQFSNWDGQPSWEWDNPRTLYFEPVAGLGNRLRALGMLLSTYSLLPCCPSAEILSSSPSDTTASVQQAVSQSRPGIEARRNGRGMLNTGSDALMSARSFCSGGGQGGWGGPEGHLAGRSAVRGQVWQPAALQLHLAGPVLVPQAAACAQFSR